MNYLAILEHSFAIDAGRKGQEKSRLEFLADHIFQFTTYDGAMSDLFAGKAVEVSRAITEQKTFDYIKDSQENYQWFLVMCNLPFFADRITWGTSIRGAFWCVYPCKFFELDTCGLWIGDEQMIETIQFSDEHWKKFIEDVIQFAEATSNQPQAAQ